MSLKPTYLLVTIVNYLTPDLTIDCLRSLMGEVESIPGTKVVVIDNDSGDDSLKEISAAIEQNAWGDWVSILPSNYNGGYAFGNNLAIRSALQQPLPPSYFFILNPDTQVIPNGLKVLVDFLEQHPDVGIAGCNLQTPEGELRRLAFHFPSVLSEFESALCLGIVTKLLSKWVVPRYMGDEPSQIDWVSGTAMLIRRQVFESVGLMDEGYFLFYEETDFCLQAKRGGWSCWYVPQSRIMNIGGQSRKKADNSNSKRQPQYWFDSRQRYFLKNHGLFYASLADTARILGLALWRIRHIIQQKPDHAPHQILIDSIRNSIFFKFRNYL